MSDARTTTRSRENTRARLMDAAFEVFAEVGLDGASVEAICERAGFTRGAFYSNFETKDELFLALVSSVAEQQLEEVSARVAQLAVSDTAPETPAQLVQHIVGSSIDSRQGVLLMSEIRIRAMRDQRLAAAYRAWQSGMNRRVVRIIDDLVGLYGLQLRMPAPDFATVLLNSWETTSADAVIEGLDYVARCALVSARTEQLAMALVEGYPASSVG